MKGIQELSVLFVQLFCKSRIISIEKEDAGYLNVQRCVYKDINCSIVYKSKKLKIMQLSIGKGLSKLCYTHIINIVIKKNHIALCVLICMSS